MTVIVDTGPLLAWVNNADPRHEAGALLVRPLLGGAAGMPMATDYVLDEGLTFLRAKTRRREVSERFASLFVGEDAPGPLSLALTGHEVIEPALDLHFKHYDRGLSFTDCTLIVHANRLGAKLATFDSAFDGLVEVVHE